MWPLTLGLNHNSNFPEPQPLLFCDKWNRLYKLPHTNNAFGLLVVLTWRVERTIFLLILKDKNALVFPLLIQSVPFFLLWVNGFVESLLVIITTGLWKLQCNSELLYSVTFNIALWQTVNKFRIKHLNLAITLYSYLKVNVIHE